MCEEICKGNCSDCGGCNGCSERVVLSCNPAVSFVSTITFSARNFQNSSQIRLVMECAKSGNDGKCFAGIKYYKKGDASVISNDRKYEITNSTKACLNLDFEPEPDCSKAEVRVFCEDGATLEIEHINVINID